MLSMRLMRFLPKIHPIRGTNKFFLLVPKSPTQIGFDGVINQEPNISCLGPFKLTLWHLVAETTVVACTLHHCAGVISILYIKVLKLEK